ncbi:class I SAM-dependent methyltransferase [Gracilibacillus sp. S3-1-1]|uniref:Class I SAM-dependent methyltransferase n=1 Tax=Gracilibacillus pellucidus TaxID=3095368 RepID=A0ACC6M5P1_9BACI|nr:class I SAM-dependent methyltransferase [Gracilibacillus sp. S3-1-1]MDX8046235.1 class I SAM-dependent methyltransferase [Gracilibacillus sp. S3-1-1]
MIITTAGRVTTDLIQYANELSFIYQVPYIERKKQSLNQLKSLYQVDILVVGKEKLFLSPFKSSDKLFFHLNLAMVRAKRLLNNKEDAFVTAANLEKGMSVLDCTFGLASDSIIASLVVGEQGVVTGLEASKAIYMLTSEGLKQTDSSYDSINEAMRRINVQHAHHLSYLTQQPTNAVDVVYFDPMFQEAIDTSNGLNPIRQHALHEDLTAEAIEEAKRVAKQRVVIKDYWKSERFQAFGFTQLKRKTALFHYGIIDVN